MKIKLVVELDYTTCCLYKKNKCMIWSNDCDKNKLCCFECTQIFECNIACQLLIEDEIFRKFIKYEEVK